MNKICCIVGAGDMSGTRLFIPDGAYIIAADAGLEHLNSAGIVPDLIVGDFDSLGNIPSGDNIVEHDPEKDDTDMMLAVKEALARGADTLILYGGLGGRLDHVFANVQTLSYIANQGARGYLVGCGSVCTAIKNGGLSFDADMKGVISVFCHGDVARGVDLLGLKYPLSKHTMTCDVPLGVSNEFTGVPSAVCVENGIVVVMWSAPQIELEKYTEI